MRCGRRTAGCVARTCRRRWRGSHWYNREMQRGALSFLLACGAVAIGCGDGAAGGGDPDAGADAGCVGLGLSSFPNDLFGAPAEFDRTSCQPGAFAGMDPSGLWFMESEEQGKFSAGPVRLSASCSDGAAATVGGTAEPIPMDLASFTDDDIFFRLRRDFEDLSLIDAFDLCGRDEAGNLTGIAVRCFIGDFGDRCSERAVVLSPFGRLPGEQEASGIELVSEWSGSAQAPWPAAFTANVEVHGDIAYVARGGDALRIVDVSNPAAPRDLGVFPAESDNYNDLAIVESGGKTYLLLASAVFGAMVLDVSDPNSPTQVARFEAFQGAGVHRLFIETVDSVVRAYVADGYSTIVGIFDVTDPTAPAMLGSFDTGNEDWGVHAAFARDGRLYVNATVGGMFAVDTKTNPALPTVLGHYTGPNQYSHASLPMTAGGREIVLHGDEGFASHLEVVDADPDSPEFMQKIGELEFRKQVSLHNMVSVGSKAYVAHYQEGVRIVELADPTNPTLAAYFNTWSPETAPGALLEGAVDLEVAGGLIYLAETPRGLLILREQ